MTPTIRETRDALYSDIKDLCERIEAIQPKHRECDWGDLGSMQFTRQALQDIADHWGV